VLADKGRSGRRAAHPGHEISKTGAGLRGQRIRGVPQIVQVQLRNTDLLAGGPPGDGMVEVPAWKGADPFRSRRPGREPGAKNVSRRWTNSGTMPDGNAAKR
jgi:hypothetical protein